LGFAADIVVHEERLRHRGRIREARGLENDGVELAFPAHQPVDDAHEVAAHGAADAAVVHLEDFFIGADDEVVVDADLAELVDDDGVLASMLFRQDAVEQGGFAGAEIAGQHGDGDLVGHARNSVRPSYICIRRRTLSWPLPPTPRRMAYAAQSLMTILRFERGATRCQLPFSTVTQPGRSGLPCGGGAVCSVINL